MKESFSNFLFPDTSFVTGAGTVINLAGNFYDANYSLSGDDADRKAIENDFRMVGQDICNSLNESKVKKHNKVSK